PPTTHPNNRVLGSHEHAEPPSRGAGPPPSNQSRASLKPGLGIHHPAHRHRPPRATGFFLFARIQNHLPGAGPPPSNCCLGGRRGPLLPWLVVWFSGSCLRRPGVIARE